MHYCSVCTPSHISSSLPFVRNLTRHDWCSVARGGGAARIAVPPVCNPPFLSTLSQNIRYGRFHVDSCSDDLSLNVHEHVSGLIILIDGEVTGKRIPVRTQNHLFPNIGQTEGNRVVVRIPRDGKVVEFVLERANPFPGSQAE